MVNRTIEAITPWMTSSLPFCVAAPFADEPTNWAEATPQMMALGYLKLPRNGSLWRGLLSKKTDFGTPLATGLVSEETIEIAAEGYDEPGGSGYRRYNYSLVSARHGPGLLNLVDDAGWIEMSGDASGTQVRIRKRVVLAESVETPFRGVLSVVLAFELWLWVTGYFVAAGAKHETVDAPRLPTTDKKIALEGQSARVAVMGGGPAGMACAWLLSNPSYAGGAAWSHPDEKFRVVVTLIEKECRLGGKAASGRRTQSEGFRIEEHGLHVAMGCYKNVLEILKWVNAADTLQSVAATRIPFLAGGDLSEAWDVKLRPWKTTSHRIVQPLHSYEKTSDRVTNGGIAPVARLLRAFARASLPPTHENSDVRLAGELVELVATIAIGLDELHLFPIWAICDPSQLLDAHYSRWVRSLQTQDEFSFQEWLARYGAADGFSDRSRLVSALTSGLFATASQIGAGTLIHGAARMFFTYADTPYKRFIGGTGEALIGPIYQSLTENGVNVRFGCTVKSLSTLDGRVSTATIVQERLADPNDFAIWGPAARAGWCVPSRSQEMKSLHDETVLADAFVLAVPPFARVISGLPEDLTADLLRIGSRATIGIQHWSDAMPRYPGAILTGLDGPLRCAASMDQLEMLESCKHPPTYACGDVGDDEANRWRQSDADLVDWLKSNSGVLRPEASTQAIYVAINDRGSDRYVCADVDTQRARRYGFDTGIDNLWLAGDWTRSAFSCGSIEAAVTAGLEAARHILETLGCVVDFSIAGAIAEKERN